ncbi:MAG: type II toxin-antitoxin system prevent-host-death family antitoxin [Micrococcales bacterium]|nr:type II toxin-antitoxin system prevent-host-death family antitoxin [Micrococcales bacterium]
MSSVGIRELRQNPSKAIQRVKDGETIVITEHGRPVAQLAPPPSSRMDRLRVAGRIVPAKRPGAPLPPLKSLPPAMPSLSEAIEESRQEARY